MQMWWPDNLLAQMPLAHIETSSTRAPNGLVLLGRVYLGGRAKLAVVPVAGPCAGPRLPTHLRNGRCKLNA